MDSACSSVQDALNLLVGFRFHPTDQILLEHYLYNKIHSLPYSTLVVFDCDLYGHMEPWDIWNSYGGIDGQDIYFFTKLKRSTNTSGQLSAHVNRKIGTGTWSGENSATPISGTNLPIIGYCKRLRYENPQSLEHHGEWIMHEYSLHESMIMPDCSDSNYVLCRIRKNERPKRKAQNICNTQSINKRVLAPQFDGMDIAKNNKRRPTRKANNNNFSSELHQIEQRVVASNTINNMSCDPETTTQTKLIPMMTTDQDISDTPYESEKVINQITGDMPYAQNMSIIQSASDVPYIPEITTDSTKETTDKVQWVSGELDFDFNEEDVEKLQWLSKVFDPDLVDDTKYDDPTNLGLFDEYQRDALVEHVLRM